MKKIILAVLALAPGLLRAETKVLIDAVPVGADFAGVSPIRLPFKDAENENPKDIELGLNGALGSILSAGAQPGFSYICLLSAPGERPVEIPIAAAKATLRLRRTHTAVYALFYRGGHELAGKLEYSVASPEAKAAKVSSTFEKIAMPPGGSTAGWIYFNLPRIQAEAEKAKAGTIFIAVKGTGSVTAVPIPGLTEPLMVPEEKTAFTAAWYMDPTATKPPAEILGHQVPVETPKPSAGSPP